MGFLHPCSVPRPWPALHRCRVPWCTLCFTAGRCPSRGRARYMCVYTCLLRGHSQGREHVSSLRSVTADVGPEPRPLVPAESFLHAGAGLSLGTSKSCGPSAVLRPSFPLGAASAVVTGGQRHVSGSRLGAGSVPAPRSVQQHHSVPGSGIGEHGRSHRVLRGRSGRGCPLHSGGRGCVLPETRAGRRVDDTQPANPRVGGGVSFLGAGVSHGRAARATRGTHSR